MAACCRLIKLVDKRCLFSSFVRPLFRQGSSVSYSSNPVPVKRNTEWPDDGLGLGSYPKLPYISAQMKEPHGWWDIQERRNYGEILHEEDDALNVWMYDAPEKSLHTPREALFNLMTAFTLLGAFMFAGYIYGNTEKGNRNDYVPKEFPYNDNHIIYKDGDPKQRLKIN